MYTFAIFATRRCSHTHTHAHTHAHTHIHTHSCAKRERSAPAASPLGWRWLPRQRCCDHRLQEPNTYPSRFLCRRYERLMQLSYMLPLPPVRILDASIICFLCRRYERFQNEIIISLLYHHMNICPDLVSF